MVVPDIFLPLGCLDLEDDPDDGQEQDDDTSSEEGEIHTVRKGQQDVVDVVRNVECWRHLVSNTEHRTPNLCDIGVIEIQDVEDSGIVGDQLIDRIGQVGLKLR